jgi:hypothetical protein
VVYSDKSVPSIYKGRFEFGGDVKVNFSEDLSIDDILSNSPGIQQQEEIFLNILIVYQIKTMYMLFYQKFSMSRIRKKLENLHIRNFHLI